MKGTNLGEFEELIMLTVALLYPEAYGVSVLNEFKSQTGRSSSIGAVHSALVRLEQKGLLNSKTQNGNEERGGRPKKLYHLTAAGKSALVKSRELRENLWEKIPKMELGLKIGLEA